MEPIVIMALGLIWFVMICYAFYLIIQLGDIT